MAGSKLATFPTMRSCRMERLAARPISIVRCRRISLITTGADRGGLARGGCAFALAAAVFVEHGNGGASAAAGGAEVADFDQAVEVADAASGFDLDFGA